jgi:hypothetical protein
MEEPEPISIKDKSTVSPVRDRLPKATVIPKIIGIISNGVS